MIAACDQELSAHVTTRTANHNLSGHRIINHLKGREAIASRRLRCPETALGKKKARNRLVLTEEEKKKSILLTKMKPAGRRGLPWTGLQFFLFAKI